MHKKFLTNLGLLLFLNLLIKPIYIFGVDRLVQHDVGNASYGIYFAIFNFSFLLTIILDFGITNFNNRNISQNTHLLTKHFSSLVGLKLILAVIYIVVVVLAGILVGYDSRLMKLLLIQGFNTFLVFFIMYIRSNLAGLHLFKTDSVVSVMDRSILIIVCLIMRKYGMFHGENGIMYFVYAQTFSYLITVVVAFFIVLNKTHTFKLKFEKLFSLMILKKSLPYAILTLLMSFSNRIDSVMIERILPKGTGDVQSGIYAQGFRILDATNMIAFLTAGMLLPIFSRMIKNKENVESLLKLITRLLLTPAIVIGVGCLFYSKELIEMLYPFNKDVDIREVYDLHLEESAHIFSLLMLSFVAFSSQYIYGTLLTANGNLKQLNIIAASAMTLNIVLNYILINKLEAYGSAISSISTQFLAAIIQLLIIQRVFKFKPNWRLINGFIVFIFGVVAINYFSKMLLAGGHFNWLICFAMMVGGSIAWSFITGMISIKAIFGFMKKAGID